MHAFLQLRIRRKFKFTLKYLVNEMNITMNGCKMQASLRPIGTFKDNFLII